MIAFEIVDIISPLREMIFHFCDNISYCNIYSNGWFLLSPCWKMYFWLHKKQIDCSNLNITVLKI